MDIIKIHKQYKQLKKECIYNKDFTEKTIKELWRLEKILKNNGIMI